MKQRWESMTPPLRAEYIVKLAVGQKKIKDVRFSDWETILSEIITGDAFGVDRIDYFRLIETLRILPKSIDGDGSSEPG
jgi:hypothetical protein